MARVFISHSSKDRSFIERELIPLFSSHEIQYWYSRDDIHTGEKWEQSTRANLRACNWFLVVLSPNAVQSSWVPAEVSIALDEKPDKVIPVMYRTCNPADLGMRLHPLQFVDYRQDVERARRKLLKTLGVELLGNSKPKPPTIVKVLKYSLVILVLVALFVIIANILKWPGRDNRATLDGDESVRKDVPIASHSLTSRDSSQDRPGSKQDKRLGIASTTERKPPSGRWSTSLDEYAEALAFDPNDPNIAYAAGVRAGERCLLRSNDGLRTWKPVVSDLRGTSIVVHPLESNWLCIAGSTVHCSRDAGETWFPGNTGLDSPRIGGMCVDPSDPKTLFALSGHPVELYSSNHDKVAWSRRGDEISATGWAVDLVVAVESSQTVLYAAIREKSESYVLRSPDRGLSWSRLPSGLPSYMEAMAKGTEEGAPLLVIATLTLYRYLEEAGMWQRVSKVPLAATVQSIHDFVVQPRTGHLFVALSGYLKSKHFNTIIRSTDGGKTWENSKYF